MCTAWWCLILDNTQYCRADTHQRTLRKAGASDSFLLFLFSGGTIMQRGGHPCPFYPAVQQLALSRFHLHRDVQKFTEKLKKSSKFANNKIFKYICNILELPFTGGHVPMTHRIRDLFIIITLKSKDYENISFITPYHSIIVCVLLYGTANHKYPYSLQGT